jgi:UDP-glucose-4-epimerase GalE
MSVLVTGGAGFIGSVVVDQLRGRGERVVVVDDLSRGFLAAVDDDVPFYQVPVGEADAIREIVTQHDVEACIHLAGLIAVGESVIEPALYWRRNVAESISLLETLTTAGVELVVFSSSAAVYGNPQEVPIPEDHKLLPTSPYGNTKLTIERVLEDLGTAGSLRATALRYFNAAGATERRGERHDPETHLIPLALRAVRNETPLRIFGTDYPTPDGTAVRDYIHVDDLVAAHVLAIDYLRAGGSSIALNLGVGHGSSVRQIVEAVGRVAGRPVDVIESERRAGDPASLVAASDRARAVLNWKPQITDLDAIIQSAWNWESRIGR